MTFDLSVNMVSQNRLSYQSTHQLQLRDDATCRELHDWLVCSDYMHPLAGPDTIWRVCGSGQWSGNLLYYIPEKEKSALLFRADVPLRELGRYGLSCFGYATPRALAESVSSGCAWKTDWDMEDEKLEALLPAYPHLLPALILAFPRHLQADVEVVLRRIPATEDSAHKPDTNLDNLWSTAQPRRHDLGHPLSFQVEGRWRAIPYRVYRTEPDLDHLSDLQRDIAHCIYTRSHDGFVREKHMRSLLARNILEPWMFPFAYKACDDYVTPIVELALHQHAHFSEPEFQHFLQQNQSAVHSSYTRMLNYWNLHRRHKYPVRERDPGYRLFCELFQSVLA